MTEPQNDYDLARALAETARTINSPGTLEDTLHSIAHAARASVPGFDHAGISVVRADGRLTTMSATSDLVWELDRLQYELGEGPCVDALHNEPLLLAQELSSEERWPRYVPRAVEAGVRAQMGLRLFAHDETLGLLNFYATACDTIDPDAPRHADLFATHAALALGHARHDDDMSQAIVTRHLIGQAIGLLMERYEITQDRAFHYLAKVSSVGQVKLRDVAQEVVDQGNRRAVAATEGGKDRADQGLN